MTDPDEPPAESAAEPPVESTQRPPVVAIVGRPNVGKSTLLNALARSRIAIVEATPGVTRDRVGVLCTLADRTVELVDTGGIGIVDRQGLDADVESQVDAALTSAHVVLFVVDAREGRMPLDERVAELLRERTEAVVLVANKVESDHVQWNIGEMATLGYGEPIPISAKEGLRLDEIEERIEALLPDDLVPLPHLPAPEMKLAVVGRVNAGKSTFVNALLERERMIVSEIPGTTRDSVDIRFEHEGQALVVIDTAGIRKERSVQGSVEFYAQRRAEKAMRRADVTALLLDASVEVGRLDRQIAAYALEHFHPVIVVANKWDVCREGGLRPPAFMKYLEASLPGLPFAPVVFTAALEGHNVDRVLEVARRLHEQGQTRVGTAEVNRVLERAFALRKPRPRQGRIGRIYYGSQVDIGPPTFTLFVNEPSLFKPAYLRFLANRFRDEMPMDEVPIRIFLKRRDRSPSKYARG